MYMANEVYTYQGQGMAPAEPKKSEIVNRNSDDLKKKSEIVNGNSDD
jgi:hypothetical protein